MMFTIRYLLSAVLLGTACSPIVAAIIKFKVCNNGAGVIYPLRWGYSEENDLVQPYPVPGKPVCVKKNTDLAIYIDWQGGPQCNHWYVTYSILQSRLTGDIYWVENSDPHGTHRANEEHCFPSPVPDFVDWALLDCRVITCSGVIDPILTTEDERDAFIVLDAPVGPMNPPWVRYLKYSCTWARYRPDENGISQWDAITNNWTDAAQRITFGLYFQHNQSKLPGGFAYPRNARAYWVGEDVFTFYLGELLTNWESGIITSGNCVDASLALSCALCSIGVDFGNRQLSGDMRYFSQEELPDPEIQESEPGYQFKTNPICPIGSNPLDDSKYYSYLWIMHQISILWNEEFSPYSRVWCATSAHKLDLFGNSYRNPPAHHPPSSHLWPLKDFWQKEDIFHGWLGLILDPFQTEQAPYLIADWKCSPTTTHRQ